MQFHKSSRRMWGGILTGLLVVSIVSCALWPLPRFSFLRGHRLVRDDADVSAYELLGESVELSRRIDHELTDEGFTRIAEERWSKGSKVEYQSPNRKMQVFLVSETDEGRPVSFWILSSGMQSKLRMAATDLVDLLSFSKRHCCVPPRIACIANLKQLEGAAATWAFENPQRTNEIPTDTDLFGPQAYIRVKPNCPAGGNYSLGHVGEDPHCSIPWHTLR